MSETLLFGHKIISLSKKDEKTGIIGDGSHTVTTARNRDLQFFRRPYRHCFVVGQGNDRTIHSDRIPCQRLTESNGNSITLLVLHIGITWFDIYIRVFEFSG